MARLLIVGGGCRGVCLAEQTGREGHATRIVTRGEARRAEIEAAGAECWIGDPNRLGTLRGALEGVTIACWLLGGASGEGESLRALHGARLRAFLTSAVDTTVRGVLYEAAVFGGGRGEVVPRGAAASTPTAALLAIGEQVAREVSDRNAMPLAVVRADPADRSMWMEEARAAVDALLSGSPTERC